MNRQAEKTRVIKIPIFGSANISIKKPTEKIYSEIEIIYKTG